MEEQYEEFDDSTTKLNFNLSLKLTLKNMSLKIFNVGLKPTFYNVENFNAESSMLVENRHCT